MEPSTKRRAFARKAAYGYRVVAVILLNTLILLIGLELGAKMILRGKQLSRPSAPRLDLTSLPYYQAQPWTDDFLRDSRLLRWRYRPFAAWRSAPLASATINIDEQGRRTPGVTCTSEAYTVFMFGGSTMWGDVAPDWGTIPAYFQQSLQAIRDAPVCVVNFGEFGYVSMQNLIRLITQLQAGRIPDLVIFYDGANEVYAAYHSGRARVHVNLPLLAERYERREHPLVTFARKRAVLTLVKYLVFNTPPTTYRTLGVDPGILADSVVKTYLKNYEIVDALAQHFGFAYAFFRQPVLAVNRKVLTVGEQHILDEMDPALTLLFEETYRRLDPVLSGYPHLHDLAPLFDDRKPLIWFDDVHITPEGNEQVARAMLAVTTRLHPQAEPQTAPLPNANQE